MVIEWIGKNWFMNKKKYWLEKCLTDSVVKKY